MRRRPSLGNMRTACRYADSLQGRGRGFFDEIAGDQASTKRTAQLLNRGKVQTREHCQVGIEFAIEDRSEPRKSRP